MNDDIAIIDDQFLIHKTLGKGFTADVLLAEHLETKVKLAIKIYKPISNYKIQQTNFSNEIKIMQSLNNSNIVKILAANNLGIYKSSTSKEDIKIMYMGLELCANGEFFDYIADICKGFCDNTCRFYFQQLLNGIKGMHDSGIAHRDLKTENLFIDSEFSLKIGDFGFAKFVELENRDKNGNLIGMLKSNLGTTGYQSPELLEGNLYNGFSNDVFSSGVILFIMYCGYPPFREAKSSDQWYKHLLNNDPISFWSVYLKNKKTPFLTESFKKLVLGMIDPNPNKRYTLNDVISSEWVTEREIDYNSVFADIKERHSIVTKNRNNNHIDDEICKSKTNNQKNYRCPLTQIFTQFFYKTCEESEIPEWKENTNFVCTSILKFDIRVKNLMNKICLYLQDKYPDIKINQIENQYEVNLLWSSPITEDQDSIDNISSINISFKLYLNHINDEEHSVIQFYKGEFMSQYEFKTFLCHMKEDFENI